jgi:nitrate reductase (cytochrome), electron transfer subunit
MKKSLVIGVAWLLAGLVAVWQAGAVEIQAVERGGMAIDTADTASSLKYYYKDAQPMVRDYLQQPPLIPHQIEDYDITVKFNKCLSCHSWVNYKEKNATKISQTHFASRDGAVLANVSARRYFCTQCHVPQVDAAPLVENTFAPVDALKVR